MRTPGLDAPVQSRTGCSRCHLLGLELFVVVSNLDLYMKKRGSEKFRVSQKDWDEGE